MEIKRKKAEITIGTTTWIIQSLFPSDFISESSWPFSFYVLKGEESKSEEWPFKDGVKPAHVIAQEKASFEKKIKVLKTGIVSPVVLDEGAEALLKEKNLSDYLIGIIFALTYDLQSILKIGRDGKIDDSARIVDRGHLEDIYIRSKMTGQEPWEMVYGSDHAPDGMNPLRHDFNTIAIRCGFEYEAKISKMRQESISNVRK